jgi:hypothetical protein
MSYDRRHSHLDGVMMKGFANALVTQGAREMSYGKSFVTQKYGVFESKMASVSEG